MVQCLHLSGLTWFTRECIGISPGSLGSHVLPSSTITAVITIKEMRIFRLYNLTPFVSSPFLQVRQSEIEQECECS